MGKPSEIDYVQNVIVVEKVDAAAFRSYLQRKPFSDADASRYLMDMSQILRLLPKPPARILDLGVGSGWTSEILAWSGYDVVGLDICPDMIEIANNKLSPTLPLSFAVYDYENPLPYSDMDAVVMYDALHHAEKEQLAITRAYAALRPNGVFICIEPGQGHSLTEDTKAAVKKFGVTEKDMPFSYVRQLLASAGFRQIEQYVRTTALPVVDVAAAGGADRQLDGAKALVHHTCHDGLTSVIVARKTAVA
jgi:SAM-dependent methyltransferase